MDTSWNYYIPRQMRIGINVWDLFCFEMYLHAWWWITTNLQIIISPTDKIFNRFIWTSSVSLLWRRRSWGINLNLKYRLSFNFLWRSLSWKCKSWWWQLLVSMDNECGVVCQVSRKDFDDENIKLLLEQSLQIFIVHRL